MDIRDRQLIERSFDQELESEEQKHLKDLLALSAEARKEHSTIKVLRDRIGQQSFQFSDGFTDRVMERIDLDHATSRSAPSRRMHAYKVTLRLAATFVLLAAVAFAFWLAPQTYRVPQGQSTTFVLPDGTIAELSSGSKLVHKPFWGRKERQVTLEGEGFFDVTHSDAPFTIETFNTEVRVLGTQFNVRAWPEQFETIVAVKEGQVEARALKATAASTRILNANDAASIANAAVRRLPNPVVDEFILWRSGGFAFQNIRLDAFVKEISRRYDQHIALDPQLASRTFGYYEPDAIVLSDLLDTVCRTLNLRHRRTANGYEIILPE